jgi:hypothetical protein
VDAIEMAGEPARRRRSGERHRRAVRLTRRGRAVLWLVALLVTGLGLVLAAPASEAADPAGPERTVVVQPGDTLWSIAQRYAPGGDPFTTIDEIRRLNGLTGYTIQAGEKLTLPRAR